MEYNVEIPMPQDEHAGLRAEIMRSGGLSATVPLSSPDAAMRLLAAARVASVDAREVYFSPASGWAANVIAPPIAGQRDAVAVSPRNETAACALVLELLTDAHQRAPGAAAATLEAARALCDAALAPPLGTADVNGNASVPTARRRASFPALRPGQRRDEGMPRARSAERSFRDEPQRRDGVLAQGGEHAVRVAARAGHRQRVLDREQAVRGDGGGDVSRGDVG